MKTPKNATKSIISQAETELLKRLLNQDKHAAREFYLSYTPKLLNYIRRRVETEQDIEEIAQDVLFAFLENLRDFTGRCSISTHLCAIANHKIVDFYRKKRLKRIVFSQIPENMLPIVAQLDPQIILDNKFLAEKITEIFARLTPRYAQTLRLKYIEGRSVVDIAKLFSVSFKSAESVLFRARQAFVKLYLKS